MRARSGGLLLVAAIAGGLALLLWCRYGAAPRQWVAAFGAPFQRWLPAGAAAPAAAVGGGRVELLEQVDRLQRDLASAQQELAQTNAIRQENLELRRLLGLPPRPGYRYVVGRVLAADPAGGGRRERLDRGRRDGLRLGQAVLAGDSLWGRVFEVTDGSALVVAVSDPACQVPALVEGPGVQGLLTGAGEERWVSQPFCLLKLLPRDVDFPAGLRVVTSPYCEQMPPAIPIGELRPRGAGPPATTVSQLYQNAWVKPFASAPAPPRFLAVLVRE